MKTSTSFHAHHSPMGAHSSLTLGMFGAQGGMAMEKGRPAPGGVYVGYMDGEGCINYLPFFEVGEDERSRYVQGEGEDAMRENIFGEKQIKRDYLWATDRFKAPGMSFELVTPFFSIPDPEKATAAELKFACCPVSFVRLEFDNRKGKKPLRGFFAMNLGGRWTPMSDLTGGELVGVQVEDRMGFATDDGDVEGFIDFDVPSSLRRQHTTPNFLLGATGGFSVEVPAGQRKQVLVAVGYFKESKATYNWETQYWYRRYFSSLVEVLDYGLSHADAYLHEAKSRDEELKKAGLNEEQKFMIAHATRSYYGSTEWLDEGGHSLWVVNEGEYLMINTFDLTVDMLFYEMRFNPWTVKNVLRTFVSKYSYRDEIFHPSNPKKLYPGGLSFTHDMGVANHFSPFGYSSYEVGGLDRECFSHMTCEQLVNWILCAGVYLCGSGDEEFLQESRGILLDTLESLQRRDHPDPKKRNGVMSFESSRTHPGGEITTYDSLDHSLGQARNNLYLAVKSWAAYVALEHLFGQLGNREEARSAAGSAKLCADAIVANFDKKLGFIPAVFEAKNRSAIIPGIEGLIFPQQMGLERAISFKGPYKKLLNTLKRHFENILVDGVCLYGDHGWKLSSTADNSWMSKICLCMHVARSVLKIDFGDDEFKFDHAHAEWQRKGSTFYACSDQFHSGVAKGSLYYPRIVTSVLWLDE